MSDEDKARVVGVPGTTGADALERVLDDGPLPAGAENDPEIARALADVEVLREQLGVLARTLTGPARATTAPEQEQEQEQEQEPEPEPEPEPVPVPHGARRRRALAWTLAASVVLGTLGVGAAYLASRPADTDGGLGGQAKLTPAGIVACASDIAEGTVVRAEALAEPGELRVVLRVERTYKPTGGPDGSGPRELAFLGVETADGGPSYFAPGTRLLALVPAAVDEPALTFKAGEAPPGEEGEDMGPVRDELEYGRKWVQSAIPGARGMTCEGPG
ncbi:hypothetical protein [Streptomyces roseolus]|uniref:hypothetical protein n=1 Tax=Streptomyces roseolus TaxID=67358 RepID=UPI00364F0BE0